MNKHLLLGCAMLVAIGAYPQNGKLAKPANFIETKSKKLDFIESSTQNSTVFTGPVKQLKPKVNSSSKIAVTTCVQFTGSMNVFGYLVSQSKPLQYNKAVNAISFIARKSATYTASSNSNSGTIVGLYSTNLGGTWNETCLWANNTNLGRYPNGGIYNPLGNTNLTNAYLVASGPVTGGTGWLGNFYASKQITTPGNNVAGPDQQAHLDAAPTIKKHAMSRYSFTTIDGGLVRSMATVVADINATTNLAYGLRGAALVKGQFNAGAFVWSVDSFIPTTTMNTGGWKNIIGLPVAAWDDAGVVGYVVILASRASETISATNVSPKGGYQPMVYKTTNSGASWSLLPAEDFSNPTNYTAVYDRMYPIASNSNIIVPNFSGSEGWDVAVDKNGQLHYATMLYGHYSNHVDSLGYRYVFGTEQYSYGENGPFNYPLIYDFYTKSSGGWGYMVVDSMGTEGPSGTSGQPGYATNPWSDGTSAKMDLDARLQINRTDDGSKIYYSWTESDSTIVGLKWNIYPDIKMKGYDVTMNKITPRFNVSGGVTTPANADQQAYYHYMSNKAVGSPSVCNDIPFTITYNATNNGGIDVNTYFLGGVQVCPAAFSITPMSPTGITENTNAQANYEVLTFPNPANEATTIVVGLKDASYFEVALYNSIGQLADTYRINGHTGANEIHIDLSNYQSGIYFYNVKVGNSVVTRKLIVQ